MKSNHKKCLAVVLLMGMVIMGTASSAFACNSALSSHFSGWSETKTDYKYKKTFISKRAVASSGCYRKNNWLKAEVRWSINNSSTSTGWVQRSRGFTLRSNYTMGSWGRPAGKAIARYSSTRP